MGSTRRTSHRCFTLVRCGWDLRLRLPRFNAAFPCGAPAHQVRAVPPCKAFGVSHFHEGVSRSLLTANRERGTRTHSVNLSVKDISVLGRVRLTQMNSTQLGSGSSREQQPSRRRAETPGLRGSCPWRCCPSPQTCLPCNPVGMVSVLGWAMRVCSPTVRDMQAPDGDVGADGEPGAASVLCT